MLIIMNQERAKEALKIGLSKVQQYKIDVTSNYREWIRLGYCIINLFGHTGEDMFHSYSSFHPNYDYEQCQKQYETLLKSFKVEKAEIKFFFYLMSNHQIQIF